LLLSAGSRAAFETGDPGFNRVLAVAAVAADPDVRDPAGSCFLVDPGGGDGELAADLGGGEQGVHCAASLAPAGVVALEALCRLEVRV
jgi:hypothetical protein